MNLKRTPTISQQRSVFSSELLDRAGSFVMVNMLRVIFAVPLVTLPIATAGLFATLTPWVRGEKSEPFRDFFGEMRQYWRTSTLIGLLDVALGC